VAKQRGDSRSTGKLLFGIPLGIVLLSAVSATATATSVSITQQPATSSPNATTTEQQRAFARAQQLFEQARQLRNQGTAESQQQALAKYEEALSIWQQLAINEAPPYMARAYEAATLGSIGTIYYAQKNEPQKALDYFNRGLAISREVKKRLQDAIARASADDAASNSGDKQKLFDTYKQVLASTSGVEASLLHALGGAYSSLGEMQKALEYYNQALSLFRAEKQSLHEAATLGSIADVYFKSGETQKALNFYNRALEIQRAEKDTAAQAQTLGNIGSIYTQLGESQKGLTVYNQALKIQQERKNLAGQADILRSIGLLYSSLGENQKALDSYNQALKLRQAAQGNLSGTALAFNLYRQADILMGMASSYTFGFGDHSKAVDCYNQARSLMQKAGSRFGEASVLDQISLVYNRLGENQKALDVLNQALVLWRPMSNPAREAFTLGNIADIYNLMGEPQQALDFYNQALDIQRRVNDRPQEAVTLNRIAGVYKSLGDYQLSIDTYKQALEIFESIGDRTHQAQILDYIGSIYQEAKDYHKSLDYHNQAMALVRQNNNLSGQASILTSIVRDYILLRDYPKALDAADQILTLSRQQNDGFWEATSFTMSGIVYLASGDVRKALESTNRALTGYQKVNSRRGEASALRSLGKVYNALKQYEKALSTYASDLALRRMLGDRTGEAETLYNVAITQRDKGNLNEARTQIEAAIKIVEDIRTRVTSQELRTSYFATVQNYYQFYIDVLMQLHKKDPSKGYDALALHASEQARARSLLELLTEANANIRQGVDPKLLQQERTLQQKFDALEKRRLEISNDKDTEAKVELLEKETASLLEEYRQIQEQIRRTNPRYAALTQPKPLTLAEIQQQVLVDAKAASRRDDDTMLLEYSLGEERSYLWAVTKTGITSYELPKREEIEAAAKDFYQLLKNQAYRLGTQRGLGVEGRPGSSVGNDEAATKLSQMLLAPVAAQLGNKRLLIVSDGALQYLPFAALPVPGTSGVGARHVVPLLVNHEIVNSPSASTLAVLRKEMSDRKIAPKAIAVLADPVFSQDDPRLPSNSGQVSGTRSQKSNLNRRALELSATTANVSFNRLPFTRQEAEQILALVPATQRMQAFDFAANRAIATSPQLQNYRIIHFATHGILNSTQPELSGVVLSLVDEKGTLQNGFLQLRDIFNLNLPAELVVLSACETGLGEEVKGEGLVGLTRGFMYAGSPRVVVSLWSVSDQATAELMAKFYKKMLQEGVKQAAALRAAQLEMWRQKQWQAPYYWAAFTLQGEWR